MSSICVVKPRDLVLDGFNADSLMRKVRFWDRRRLVCMSKTLFAVKVPSFIFGIIFPGQTRPRIVLPMMKSKPLFFCLLAGAASLLPIAAQPAPTNNHVDGVATLGGKEDESDAGGPVRVDVVTDMTDAGKKIAPPDSDHPVYYLPMPIGYKEFGYSAHFQRTPPSADEVEHMLGVALAQQNFQLMSHEHHPSIVLNFWWGYMAPPERDHLAFEGASPTTTGSAAITSSTSPIGNAESALAAASHDQMLDLVAGESFGDEGNPLDPRKQEVNGMLLDPRYYIMVSAYDFNSWLENYKESRSGRPVVTKPILLWKAHISTELWGHYFDQVAQTLINAGAPWFGRQTHGPKVGTIPMVPTGRVILGTPEVKEYGSNSAAPGK